MILRAAKQHDLPALLALYAHLHGEEIPADERSGEIWQRMLAQSGLTVVLAVVDDLPVSTCTVSIIPNLTHGGRPYALIENVVTHPQHRGKGLATACLQQACALARQAGCYKAMLLTGSRQPSTLRFYQNAGFDPHSKTAFVRWLD